MKFGDKPVTNKDKQLKINVKVLKLNENQMKH